MSFLEDFYGNDRQKAYFSSLIAEGKCSHAYILEAPAGSGKKTFARLLAAAIAFSSEKAENERDAKCRRIMEGTSPDVMMLTREEGKKSIGVDATRDFCASVYLTPSELSFKMYIFDEADKITPQAQNALLKIIEEPPHGVYMVLLCENSLSLLSTVRSRAQKISLEVFEEEKLRAYARTNALPGADDEDKLSFALHMAGGSIGKLMTLLESGDTEFSAYSTAKRVVEGQVSKGRGVSYFDFLKNITDFASTREALDALTKYLLSAYGDLIRIKHTDDPPLHFFGAQEAEKIALFLTTEAIADSFSATDSVRADTLYNTSLSLSAATLAMALWKVC
jgi:DNA polymerase-3 subunit delta'